MIKCCKIHYKNRVTAKKEIKKLKQRGNKEKLSGYYCAECGGYHITKADSDDKRAVRDNKHRFEVGQVWRNRWHLKDKFEVLSVPINGDGLRFILSNFYLTEG
ncbi:MAG: hypothetical protein CMJ25_13600 [Phycisphaerae bacterium]|nr:hypothetical protein [Phycisphaerae bacterium]|tara:strand:+ start:1098 stop:1406 length:309 start_codon:yes stop_codon:yes gene_type:complete